MENWFCLMRIILKAFRSHNMKKLSIITLFLFVQIEKAFSFENMSEHIHTKIGGFILCFEEMILLGAQPRCSATK